MRWVTRIVTLVCLLAFSQAVAGGVKHGTTEWKKAEVEYAALYLPLEIETDVSWKFCGDENGLYYPSTGEIVLCEENLYRGVAFARGVMAHELGHAVTFQHYWDFGRWKGNYEDAADEFAALLAFAQGHPEDVMALANWFDEFAPRKPSKDPHSTPQDRAAYLRCLVLGYYVPFGPCGIKYRNALNYWMSEIGKRVE